MQGLESPAPADEFARQPIEQFRMRRFAPLDAEIIGCGNKPLTEVVLP